MVAVKDYTTITPATGVNLRKFIVRFLKSSKIMLAKISREFEAVCQLRNERLQSIKVGDRISSIVSTRRRLECVLTMSCRGLLDMLVCCVFAASGYCNCMKAFFQV